MGVYLVDRDLPRITSDGLAALQRAEISASQRLTAAGQRVRVRLALSKAGTKALRRTLSRRRRATATVTILASDGAGNQTSRKVSIRAKR